MWFEKADPLLGKAKKHFELSIRKNFVKEGFNDKVSIVPNKLVTLHFNITEKEFLKFIEVCKNFSDDYKTSLKIISEEGMTTLEIPRDDLFEFARKLENSKGFELDKPEIEEIKTIIGDK